MADFFLVFDCDGPGQHAVIDAEDGCFGPDYCGGCDACMYLQLLHCDAPMAPVHWVAQREVP
jgi:hypothetical protein